MKYIFKSGILFDEDGHIPLAKMKGDFIGPRKSVFLKDEIPVLKINIQVSEPLPGERKNIYLREYTMIDASGDIVAVGKPDYAEGENPETAGWPICRMPHVNHANIHMAGSDYLMMMHNSQNYSLQNATGDILLRIVHRGFTGGWNIESKVDFKPEILCGFFAFCRYIEQENELMIV